MNPSTPSMTREEAVLASTREQLAGAMAANVDLSVELAIARQEIARLTAEARAREERDALGFTDADPIPVVTDSGSADPGR